MDETAEQIQQILDLLPEDHASPIEPSLWLWLEGQFLEAANSQWKDLSRYEHAEQYIEWLRKEKDGEYA